VRACVRACVRVGVCACVCMCARASVCACVRASVYAREYVCVCVCMCGCVCVCVCVHFNFWTSWMNFKTTVAILRDWRSIQTRNLSYMQSARKHGGPVELAVGGSDTSATNFYVLQWGTVTDGIKDAVLLGYNIMGGGPDQILDSFHFRKEKFIKHFSWVLWTCN
jgi:hypothetical protein